MFVVGGIDFGVDDAEVLGIGFKVGEVCSVLIGWLAFASRASVAFFFLRGGGKQTNRWSVDRI